MLDLRPAGSTANARIEARDKVGPSGPGSGTLTRAVQKAHHLSSLMELPANRMINQENV